MSDHFSGPRALAGPQGDICDFYAFPSPERPGSLVLIMNVVPRADRSASFSDAIVNRFRLRSLTVDATGPAFRPGGAELTVDVTFAAAEPGTAAQVGRCTATGVAVDFTVGDPRVVGGRRVFAGLRADPFFLDFDALQKTLAIGQLAFTPAGILAGPGADVLGVVVELDAESLAAAGIGPLVAAVAETVSAGPLPIRLERVGRPEVKNLLLSIKNFDPLNRNIDLRDLYNLEDPFHVGPDYRGAYRSRLDANLAYLDTLDGAVGWPLGPGGQHPLTELILADFLVVDVSEPYTEDGFLGIERAVLSGQPPVGRGGRAPNEDAMDELYTLVFGGLDAQPIRDHVDAPTRPATNTFPYLAAPNLTAVPTRPVGANSASAGAHEHYRPGHYQL